jgi:translation elongation factor EF-4
MYTLSSYCFRRRCCCCCRYASFDYEEGPLRPADLTLLELLVNGKPVDALGRLVPTSE